MKWIKQVELSHYMMKNNNLFNLLKDTEKKYRSILEAVKVPISFISPDFQVEYMNPAMIRKLGYDASGTLCSRAIFGLSKKCSWYVLEKAQKGESVVTEFFNPKDGHTYHVSASPIFYEDNLISMMFVYRDITQRKHLDEEREKLIKEFQKPLFDIKSLSGLLPICSYCKKKRDDKRYWRQIQTYISERSNAMFGHSICRQCADKYYPEINLYQNDESY